VTVAARRLIERARVIGRTAVIPVAATALVVAAGMLASLALFALATGLAAAVLAAAAVVAVARRRVTVIRTVAEREVREDEPLRLSFQVRGLGLLPVRLLAPDRAGRWSPLGDIVELDVGRRGGYRLEPSELRLSDALGIFHRTIRAGRPETVLVLPVPDTGVYFPSRNGPRADETEPDGLRPYVPGTPLSRVHWPSLARGAGLHEIRQAPPPPTGLPLVVVDTAGADDLAALDWLARAAAGYVLRLIAAGGCGVLLPGDTTATAVRDRGQWRTVHRRLAVLDKGPRGPEAVGAAVVAVPAGHEFQRTEAALPAWVTPAPPGSFEWLMDRPDGAGR